LVKGTRGVLALMTMSLADGTIFLETAAASLAGVDGRLAPRTTSFALATGLLADADAFLENVKAGPADTAVVLDDPRVLLGLAIRLLVFEWMVGGARL
jgi:hypothetical protein